MGSKFLKFLFIFSCLCAVSQAQRFKYNIVVKADVATAAMNVISPYRAASFSVEKLFGKFHGIQYSNLLFQFPRTPREEVSFKILNFMLDYKYFLFHKKEYHGLYSGLSANYIFYEEAHQFVYKNEIFDSYKQQIAAFTLNIGHQTFLYKEKICLDVVLGYGLKTLIKHQIVVPNLIDNTAIQKDAIRIALNLGWRF